MKEQLIKCWPLLEAVRAGGRGRYVRENIAANTKVDRAASLQDFLDYPEFCLVIMPTGEIVYHDHRKPPCPD